MTGSSSPWTEAELSQFVSDACDFWDGTSTNNMQPAPAVFSNGGLSALSLSLPRLNPHSFVDWLGRRLIFWPDGIVMSHRISVASSRLGKRKDLKSWWFDGLRTTLLRCEADKECLCVVEGTAAEPYVVRGGELFGMPCLRIQIAAHEQKDVVADETELLQWLMKAQNKAAVEPTTDQIHRAWISPELVPNSSVGNKTNSVQDSALALAGERIVVLSCQAKGNVEAVISQRLKLSDSLAPITLLATIDESPPPSETLVGLGAVPWYLNGEDSTESVQQNAGVDVESNQTVDGAGPLECPNEWLCHWTRPAFGPWLDQPTDDFIDELILGCESADRSAVAALLRIVSQKKIVASLSTAGEPSTVSFTAVPLAEFRSRRIFRRHKQRYDFEPWGIAIRKSVVQQLGAAAVQYLATKHEPSTARFTQQQFDKSKRIDWSAEKEWRLAGDLLLSDVADDAIVLFVDSQKTLHHVQMHSRWRTIVLPD